MQDNQTPVTDINVEPEAAPPLPSYLEKKSLLKR